MRRLALDYLSFDDRLELGLASLDDMPGEQTSLLDEGSVPQATANVTDVRQAKIEDTEPVSQAMAPVATAEPVEQKAIKDTTAPLCYNCGNQTQRSGSCYVCSSCGSTTGCS